MKLEVGMYVRTKWGYICELININDFREPAYKYGVEANYLRDIMFIGVEDILKASYNIIDLIEVGDYVNGKEIIKKFDNEFGKYLLYGSNDGNHQLVITIYEDEIKSIVTKEQFEAMKYEIK